MIDNTNYSFLNQKSPIPLVSYCDGPAISRPTGLFSGEYFSGRYGIFLNTDGSIISRSLTSQDEIVTRSSTGVYINYLTGIVNSSANYEFSNIASCFDNNAQPIVAIQNNTTNGGYIYLAYNSGFAVTGWSGYNPAVYNTANINYPLSVPTPIFPTFKSGQIACYYTNATGSILYARYSKDNFYQEYPLHSGLATGFVLNFAGSAFTIRESNIKDYPSYVKRLYAYDTNRNLVTYTSYPSVNFAMDDFSRNIAGNISVLDSGWGRWLRKSSFHPTSGITFSKDSYAYDSYTGYASGAYSGKNAAKSFNFQGYLLDWTVTGADVYGYDSYQAYTAGTYTGIIPTLANGIAMTFGDWVIYNTNAITADDFESYATGNLAYLSPVLYYTISTGITLTSGRIINSGSV